MEKQIENDKNLKNNEITTDKQGNEYDLQKREEEEKIKEKQPLLAKASCSQSSSYLLPIPPHSSNYNQFYITDTNTLHNTNSLPSNRESKPLIQRDDCGFLSTINSKCCWINPQAFILGLAAIMIISTIIAALYIAYS